MQIRNRMTWRNMNRKKRLRERWIRNRRMKVKLIGEGGREKGLGGL
jgi:hypothetical protein